MPETVICNTSCLIALTSIQAVPLLENLYKTVIIPDGVEEEFGNVEVSNRKVVTVNTPLLQVLTEELNLGKGEAQVIALALELKNTVILDDQKARKTAKEFGLKVTGTIGILLRAEEEALIESAYQKAVQLKQNGFHLSNSILTELEQ